MNWVLSYYLQCFSFWIGNVFQFFRTSLSNYEFILYSFLHEGTNHVQTLGAHSTTAMLQPSIFFFFLKVIFQDCGAANLQLFDILHRSLHQRSILDSTTASFSLWKLIKIHFCRITELQIFEEHLFFFIVHDVPFSSNWKWYLHFFSFVVVL